MGMLSGVVGSYPRPVAADSDPPAGLDWDRWLGPARCGVTTATCIAGGTAIGTIPEVTLRTRSTSICLGWSWATRRTRKRSRAWAAAYQFDDRGEMPDVQIVAYQYPKMVVSFLNTGFTPYLAKSPAEVRYGKKWPYWPQNADRIEIFGTRRMMYLGRHGAGWQVFEGENKLVAEDKGYHPDKWHIPNFIDCIRSRKRPNGDIEQGHHSACLEHFANVPIAAAAGIWPIDQ